MLVWAKRVRMLAGDSRAGSGPSPKPKKPCHVFFKLLIGKGSEEPFFLAGGQLSKLVEMRQNSELINLPSRGSDLCFCASWIRQTVWIRATERIQICFRCSDRYQLANKNSVWLPGLFGVWCFAILELFHKSCILVGFSAC